MNLLKFNRAGDNIDIYINADKITSVISNFIYDGCVVIHTIGGDAFKVKGDADAVARYIMTSCVDDTIALEKRCGLCGHYEIGSHKQCRKHFENRNEDDKVCHFYEP